MTPSTPGGPPVRVYRDGRVLTPDGSVATALAVRGAALAYVGSTAGARAHAPGAPEVDLGGRLVTPAFVDAHLHTVQTGQALTGLDLAGLHSREAVLDALAAYAARHRGLRVVVGQGWEQERWPDPRPPRRSELDAATGGATVYLARVDVHSAVVSSALLRGLPGIEGEPGFDDSGLLTREAHHRARDRVASLFGDEERRTAARAALRHAAGLGIGAVHELGGPHLGPLEDLVRVRDEARAVGLDCVTYWGEAWSPAAEQRARSVGAAGLAGDLCVDGALGSRTAALHEPYADAGTRGVRYLTVAEITEHLLGCTRSGLQAGFHCIGDDAVAAVVEGLRQAAAVTGTDVLRAARHRLEHVEMLAGPDLAVLAELGVVAGVQPGFDAAWGGPGELYERRLGPTRAATMNRFGTAHRSGVALAFGSDAPVTPLAGWETVRAAVRPSRSDQALDPLVAFDAATRGGHHAARVGDAGTLTAGSRASFAVWDHRPEPGAPVGLPPLDGSGLPACLLTVAGGRVAHDPDGLVET